MDEETEAACWRLDAFSDKFGKGDIIDAGTGLTRGDLDLILTRLGQTRRVRMMPVYAFSQLTPERIAELTGRAAQPSLL